MLIGGGLLFVQVNASGATPRHKTAHHKMKTRKGKKPLRRRTQTTATRHNKANTIPKSRKIV